MDEKNKISIQLKFIKNVTSLELRVSFYDPDNAGLFSIIVQGHEIAFENNPESALIRLFMERLNQHIDQIPYISAIKEHHIKTVLDNSIIFIL